MGNSTFVPELKEQPAEGGARTVLDRLRPEFSAARMSSAAPTRETGLKNSPPRGVAELFSRRPSELSADAGTSIGGTARETGPRNSPPRGWRTVPGPVASRIAAGGVVALARRSGRCRQGEGAVEGVWPQAPLTSCGRILLPAARA